MYFQNVGKITVRLHGITLRKQCSFRVQSQSIWCEFMIKMYSMDIFNVFDKAVH